MDNFMIDGPDLSKVPVMPYKRSPEEIAAFDEKSRQAVRRAHDIIGISALNLIDLKESPERNQDKENV